MHTILSDRLQSCLPCLLGGVGKLGRSAKTPQLGPAVDSDLGGFGVHLHLDKDPSCSILPSRPPQLHLPALGSCLSRFPDAASSSSSCLTAQADHANACFHALSSQTFFFLCRSLPFRLCLLLVFLSTCYRQKSREGLPLAIASEAEAVAVASSNAVGKMDLQTTGQKATDG